MRRVLVLALISSILVVTQTGEASACSCAPLDPASGMSSSEAVFIGSFTGAKDRTLPSGFTSARYEFEVEQWLKGDLGSPVWIHSAADGAGCGFETPPGERVAVYVRIANGVPTSGLCSTGSPDALLASLQPLVFDGSGPARYVIAGTSGPLRLILMDAEGGLLAATGGGDWSTELDVCPGEERMVELTSTEVVVWDIASLTAVRTIDVADLQQTMGVRLLGCEDPMGDGIQLWLDDFETGSRVVRADDLDDPLLTGPFFHVERTASGWIATTRPPGHEVWLYDDSGAGRIMRRITALPGDSEPSVSIAVDPTGTKVAVSVARFRDGTDGSTVYHIHDTADGEALGDVGPRPIGDIAGWASSDRLVFHDYPVDADVPTSYLLDTTTFEVAPIDSTSVGWPVLEVDGSFVVSRGGRVDLVSPIDGTRHMLATFPTDAHRVVAVLDQGPLVDAATPLPATAAPETTVPPVTIGAQSPPEATSSSSAAAPIAVVVAATAVLGAVWWFRRRSV